MSRYSRSDVAFAVLSAKTKEKFSRKPPDAAEEDANEFFLLLGLETGKEGKKRRGRFR